MIQITNTDLYLVKQHLLNLRFRLDLYDKDDNYITTITCGLVSGNNSITADSSIRRTASLSLIPDRKSRLYLDQNALIWIDKKAKIYIGIQNLRTKEYKYYKQGEFVLTSASISFSATDNTMSLECSDYMSMLDGTKNGQLGALITKIYANKEYLMSSWLTEAKSKGINIDNINSLFEWLKINYPNELTNTTDDAIKEAAYKLITNKNLTAEKRATYFELLQTIIPRIEYTYDSDVATLTEPNIIRTALIKTLTELGRVNNYNVDDIGYIKGLPQYNDNYITYRIENIYDWNTIPYDLEFSAGCSVLSILEELVNLYPNYEHYFNEDGVYCCNMIPSCDEDDITFYNDFMQSILISENTSVDLSTVRNMVMVWGKIIETDFYAKDNVVLSDNIYKATIQGYEDEYFNNDIIALAIPNTNPANAKININGFGDIPIYDSNKDKPLEANYLEANNTYAFKIKKKYSDTEGKNVIRADYLGNWQVQSLSVLTDGTVSDDDYTTTSGTTVKRYSKEYFQEVYSCKNVELTVCPESPFTVQKLGEILQVCTGGEYEQIGDIPKALATGNYELFKHARMTDNITITTKIVPFADVNIKVQYQPKSFEADTEHQYIVKGISHDYMGGTTSWTLIRFYNLYEKVIED
jgi:hypothetical protein